MIVQGQGKLAAAGGHVDVGGGDKGIIVKLERQGPQNSRDHGNWWSFDLKKTTQT